MTRRNRTGVTVDVGEVLDAVGAVLRFARSLKEKVKHAKADGTFTRDEVIAIVRAALADADDLVETIADVVED